MYVFVSNKYIFGHIENVKLRFYYNTVQAADSKLRNLKVSTSGWKVTNMLLNIFLLKHSASDLWRIIGMLDGSNTPWNQREKICKCWINTILKISTAHENRFRKYTHIVTVLLSKPLESIW